MKHKYLFRFSRWLNAQQYLISQERNSKCHYNSSFTVLGTFSIPLVAWKPFNASNLPSTPLTNQYWLPSAQSFYQVSRNFSPVCPMVAAFMKRLLPQRYYGPALLTMLLSWHLIDRNKSSTETDGLQWKRPINLHTIKRGVSTQSGVRMEWFAQSSVTVTLLFCHGGITVCARKHLNHNRACPPELLLTFLIIPMMSCTVLSFLCYYSWCQLLYLNILPF